MFWVIFEMTRYIQTLILVRVSLIAALCICCKLSSLYPPRSSKDFHIVLAFTLIPGAEVCQLVSLEKAPFAEGNAFDAASLQQRFDNPECSSCSAHSRPKSDICARNAITLRRMRRCVRMNSSLSTVQCGKLILTRICLLYSAVHTHGFESIYHSN